MNNISLQVNEEGVPFQHAGNFPIVHKQMTGIKSAFQVMCFYLENIIFEWEQCNQCHHLTEEIYLMKKFHFKGNKTLVYNVLK